MFNDFLQLVCQASTIKSQPRHGEVVALAVYPRCHDPDDNHRSIRLDAEDNAELPITNDKLAKGSQLRAKRCPSLLRLGR